MSRKIRFALKRMDEVIKNGFKWAALNVGQKYPFWSTIGIMLVAAILWNWYFRSVPAEELKTPTTINDNKTTGANSPIIPDNHGTVTITDPSQSAPTKGTQPSPK